jgi:hypothetical protein
MSQIILRYALRAMRYAKGAMLYAVAIVPLAFEMLHTFELKKAVLGIRECTKTKNSRNIEIF